MKSSGNRIEFDFLKSEERSSQWHGSFAAAPHSVLSTGGLKEKMSIIQSLHEHHPTPTQKTRSNFWQSERGSGLIVFPRSSSLYVDHMDMLITRGMNQQILDLEPKNHTTP